MHTDMLLRIPIAGQWASLRKMRNRKEHWYIQHFSLRGPEGQPTLRDIGSFQANNSVTMRSLICLRERTSKSLWIQTYSKKVLSMPPRVQFLIQNKPSWFHFFFSIKFSFLTWAASLWTQGLIHYLLSWEYPACPQDNTFLCCHSSAVAASQCTLGSGQMRPRGVWAPGILISFSPQAEPRGCLSPTRRCAYCVTI